jgi:PAS domain S-box-containing protein
MLEFLKELLTFSPVRNAERKAIGASKIARDISARERNEAALRFLAESSKELAELRDVPTTLQKIAGLAVPYFADWCAVDTLQPDGSLRRVAVAHVDPTKVELANELSRRFPPGPTAPQGPWHIVRTGRSEIIPEITEPLLLETVKDDEYRRILRDLGVKSYIGVPLQTRGKTLGAMTFTAAESAHRYELADLRLAEDLGQRAAIAIENASLYSDLKAADRQLRIVTESMSTPVTRCGRDFRYLWVNKPYAEWIGRPADEIMGRPIGDVLGDKAFEQLRPHFERVLRGEKVQYEEAVNFRGLGRRWINAVYSPTFDGAGVPDGWVAVVLDIDERKRTEQTVRTLLRISERLNSTLDVDELLGILVEEAIHLVGAESGVAGLHMTEGMVCHKYYQNGRPVPMEYCWPAKRGLPGWVLEHKVPYLTNDTSTDHQILHAWCAQFGVRSALCMPILNSRQEVLGFFEIHNKEGGFVASDQEKLLAVSQAASVAIQNALAYSRVQQAEESLREADRRKDEFLAMLAHELRNPLAPIRNALHVMKMAGTNSPAAEQSRQMMERQVRHLIRLVDDLLDVSRIMRGRIELRKEPVELAAILAHAVETAQPILDSRQQELVRSVPTESVWLDADPTRLAQVVGNLLHNAAKFSQKAGRVWLTSERRGEEAVVRVRDEGAGIPAALLPHLFELFVQGSSSLERSQGGLGIGLTVVRKLVELHGGKVTAHSDGPGNGSEFIVHLPILQGRPGQFEDGSPSDTVRQSTSRRVLVVDDNVDAAQSIATLLQLWGYEVRVAHSGQEALPTAETFQPEVVLLDIGLPGMDGYEIAQRLRAQTGFEETILIALTGYGQEGDRCRSKDAGFDHHVTKPVEPDVLQKLLTCLSP